MQCEHETKGYWKIKDAAGKIYGKKKQIDEVRKSGLLIKCHQMSKGKFEP